MAKKYAGRGLKTITVSGPGIPTQKFKICVGNHPEDIEKWIEERRRRFPRMNGSQRDSGGVDRDSAGTKRNRQREGQGNVVQKRIRVDENAKSDSTSKEGAETGGLSSLLGGYDSSSSEGEEAGLKCKPADQVEDAPTSPAIPSLEGESAKISVHDAASNVPQPKRLCKYYQRGKCHHGTSCKFLHSHDNTPKDPSWQSKKRQSQSERDKANNQYQRELQILGLATPGHGSRYTAGGKVINNTSLLHKLLQRDKERERRLTLKLLRYIVDGDYFQGEDATSKTFVEEVHADDGDAK